MPAPLRCAAHPGRPSVDACPVCARPRCAADAVGRDCPVCRVTAPQLGSARRTARNRELLVRAALASNAVAVAMGYVVAEYVQAEGFQYAAPVILGLMCGWAAASAAGNPGAGVLLNRVRLVCATYALLGTALGFVLEGTYSALSTSPDVWVPYLLAVGAVWVWLTPSKKKRQAG